MKERRNIRKLLEEIEASNCYTREEGRRIQNYGMSHGFGNIKTIEKLENDSFKVTYYFGEATLSQTDLLIYTDAIMREQEKARLEEMKSAEKKAEWGLSFDDDDITKLLLAASQQVEHYLSHGNILVTAPIFEKAMSTYRCKITFRKVSMQEILNESK